MMKRNGHKNVLSVIPNVNNKSTEADSINETCKQIHNQKTAIQNQFINYTHRVIRSCSTTLREVVEEIIWSKNVNEVLPDLPPFLS